MSKIDDLDLKILSELSNDAAVSVPKLSKKININASVVYSRIKRLVRRGFIKKFTIVINDAMNSHSLDEMHHLISERIGRIEGIQKTETFIEMRKTMREILFPTTKSK